MNDDRMLDEVLKTNRNLNSIRSFYNFIFTGFIFITLLLILIIPRSQSSAIIGSNEVSQPNIVNYLSY